VHGHQLAVKQQAAQGRKSERGASLIEYALLLALIAVVVFGAVSFFGDSTSGGFKTSACSIKVAYENASASTCP
jgi:pilus assembly protein Flp/PilA